MKARDLALAILVALVVALAAALLVHAQTQAQPAATPPSAAGVPIHFSLDCPDTSVNTPDCARLLRLQVKQRDALLAQHAMQQAQDAYVSAMADLNKAADEVKRAKGWPGDVRFDPGTLSFMEPPTPPAPKLGAKK
jgi:uncharacterized protein YggE